MVPRIGEEFGGELLVDRIVEDVRGDAREER